MEFALTLVGQPQGPTITEIATSAAGRLRGQLLWLDEDHAADILFDAPGDAGANEIAAALIGDHPIDMAVQPRHGRAKKLLVGDMDSTFITVECIDVLAARAGLGDAVAAITQSSIRGELDFSDSLRERVALLEGASESLLLDAWNEDVAMTPGGKTLLATMAHHGAQTALVSGGFTWFTERVVAQLGFDHHRANVLEIHDGRITGKVTEPVLDRDAKRIILGELHRSLGLSIAETLTVGDGANDIAMLRAAGLGIAYHPVPAAAQAADATVLHGDLTTLLFYQGYCREEFVAVI